MVITGAVDIGNVPITMLPVKMNISALLLDKKVSQNIVPLYSRDAQREDRIT